MEKDQKNVGQDSFSIRRLPTLILVAFIIVASLLSIRITSSVLPIIAYGENKDAIKNDHENNTIDKGATGIKVKSSSDKAGLTEAKLIKPKSSEDITYVLKKQLETLKIQKVEEDKLAIEKKSHQILVMKQKSEREAKAKAIKEAQELAEKKRQEELILDKSKIVIQSQDQALNLDIRTKSNWVAEDFKKVIPEKMWNLIPVAIRLEKEAGINALYAIAVGATETGWGTKMAGQFNYFNWSNDGVHHFNFKSIQEFSDYSLKTYSAYYKDTSFFAKALGKTPDRISPCVVNTKYAIMTDGSVNWEWSKTVSSIMKQLSDLRQAK